MNSNSDRLKSVFGGAGWQRLTSRLRDYRDAGNPLPSSISIEKATSDERRAVAAVLRQPLSKATTLRVDLSLVLSALDAAGISTSWDSILDQIYGPVPPARIAARIKAQAWDDIWEDELVFKDHDPFIGAVEWIKKMRRDGLLKRLCAGDPKIGSQLLADASRLLRLLPLCDEDLLARVAANNFGDSHALDMDRPLSTLVFRGLCERDHQPMPVSQREKRERWGKYGIICDDLSAPVLTLNLRFGGNSPLSIITRGASDAGFPVHLTTRLLWRTDWNDVVCPTRVFVCENPAVVAICAEKYGSHSLPLVCVDGEPKTALRILLRQLRNAGAELYYHGDFDWAGVSIAGRLMEEFGASAWRFTAADYSAVNQPGRPLNGRPVATTWDVGLSTAMQTRGLAFDEEGIANTLIADLAVP